MIPEKTCRELAQFAAGLTYPTIPPEPIEKAKQIVLDVVRLALLGSRLTWGERTRRVFRDIGGKEESTVIGFGDRLPAVHAAYVNGTTSHGLENDDTHVGAIHHPGVTTIPAVLAVAEREGRDGKALLAGVIAGYEVMIRLGEAPPEKIDRVNYIVAGPKPSASAKELADLVAAKVPGAQIRFETDPELKKILDELIKPIDDRFARQEWGWEPEYDQERMVDDFIDEMKRRPHRYED